jgi:hypothetical protein
VNRWAHRHRAALEAELEPGETLLAALSVSMVPGTKWVDDLPVPGRLFALAVTDQRLIAWRVSKLLARPVEPTASVPIESVAAMHVHRHAVGHRLIVLVGGGRLVVRSLSPGSLKPLGTAFRAARPDLP